MNVNESVYGSKDKWIKYSTSQYIEEKNGYKYANFTDAETTHLVNGNLNNGSINLKLQFNQPIDNSVAFLGVDSNCELANQHWYRLGESELTDIAMRKTDANPLCFVSYSASAIPNNYNNFALSTDNVAWAYNMVKTNNIDCNIVPVTYVPVKSKYLIIVQAWNKSFVPTAPTTVTRWTGDLYQYVNGETTDGTKNYEEYPYVKAVMLFPNVKLTGSANDYEFVSNTRRLMPVVMQQLAQFVDPQYDGKVYNVLRYLQPTTSTVIQTAVGTLNDTTTTNLNLSGTVPIMLMGNVQEYYTGSLNRYFGLVGDINKFYDYTKYRLWWYKHIDDFGGIDKFAEYCRRQCSYLGGFFCERYDYSRKPTYDDVNTYLGIIDDNGVTHGDYSVGEDNKKQKQYQWDNFDDNNFDPTKKPDVPDEERPSDKYNWSRNHNYGLAGGNYYAITFEEIQSLKKWCHDIVFPQAKFVVGTPEEGQYSYEELGYNLEFRFNGQYPEDQFISLMYYPFSVTDYLTGAGIVPSVNIKLGNVRTQTVEDWFGTTVEGVTGWKLDSGTNYCEFNSGDYLISEQFGDFRDYPPYTSMTLVIPWHGCVELDVGEWYGHYINTKMIVDIITGASSTAILRDGIVVGTIDGQVGVPVQLIVRNVGDFTNTLIQGSQQLNQQKLAIAGTVIGAGITVAGIGANTVAGTMGNAEAMGNAYAGLGNLAKQAVGGLQQAAQYENTKFKIEHTKAGSSIVSQQAPAVAMYYEQTPRLIFHYPRLMSGYNASVYGATVGFACSKQGTVGSNRGYSVFSGADLSGVTATDSEKQMIYDSLKSGVII